MKVFKTIGKLALVLALLPLSVSHAGEYAGLLQPYFFNDGLYLNPIGGARASLPACATRGTMRLVEDPNSLVHKQKYAMLLGLWLSNRSVTLKGNGSCTTEGDEIMTIVMPG